MPTDPTPTPPAAATDQAEDAGKLPGGRPLPAAAERALAEAAARRAEAEAEREKAEPPKEIAGRGGLEPTRYGDWEVNGLTSDF
jgi:hypothetical protein